MIIGTQRDNIRDAWHFVIHYAVSGELPQERKKIVRLKSGQSIEFREDVLP